MRITRFRSPGRPPYSYGYIRANIIERYFIDKRIKAGDNRIISVKEIERRSGWPAPGPRWIGAQYIIRATPFTW